MVQNREGDTIAAIATGIGNAGIAIVRISGEESFSVIDRIFVSKKEKKLSVQPSHTAHFGYICDGEEKIDEVLVLIMKAPHSYTGEDTVEINCHGGPLVTRRILETVIRYGARCAEPGEFTKRAFLNGRMDLAEAEAVIGVIHAQNDFALRTSVAQLNGALSDKIRAMREEILNAAAFIEAALDDPEHLSTDGYGETLLSQMEESRREISGWIDSFENGRMLSEGVKTVILGKPNAGKSSLMNLFAGEEKAIVTEIAGTTRDVLTEQIQIGGIGFQILDTAGIRKTEDPVEKIGVERSVKQAENADLILYVVDSSVPLDENDEKILQMTADKRCVIVYNKSDLAAVVGTEELHRCNPDAQIVKISAKEKQGFTELTECLTGLFAEGKLQYNDQVVITNIRHKEALICAKRSIENVQESIRQGMPEDFWTIDLKDAYESLGKIVGEAVDEDVVNRIFEKFCMGK